MYFQNKEWSWFCGCDFWLFVPSFIYLLPFQILVGMGQCPIPTKFFKLTKNALKVMTRALEYLLGHVFFKIHSFLKERDDLKGEISDIVWPVPYQLNSQNGPFMVAQANVGS